MQLFSTMRRTRAQLRVSMGMETLLSVGVRDFAKPACGRILDK